MLPKLPCPSISGVRIVNGWAIRTSASYTDPSPCGWNLPNTSPTIRALLRYWLPGRIPMSCMAYRIRLCTGFNPSRTSGNARDTMTDMA